MTKVTLNQFDATMKIKIYDAVLFDRREHWTVDVTVRATSESEALKEIERNYSPKRYSIHRYPRAYGQL